VFLVAFVVANCVNNCNSHGSCTGGQCVCNTGWGGDDCSVWDKEIASDDPQSGHLATFQWKYYHVSLPNGANGIHVSVTQTSSFGDIDLFVAKDRYPDISNFDFSDTSTGTRLTIDVAPANRGTWYIGLYGYWSADYSITVEVQMACTVDCGQFGYCDVDVCACYEPYEGEDCTIYNEPLESGRTVYNSVETGEWKYFYVDVEVGNVFSLEMYQTDSSYNYDLDVYVATDRLPVDRNFDYLNATTLSPTEMHLTNLPAARYEIGIYGYRGGPFSLEVSVVAVEPATCANDCSTHGSCSGSGVCSCYNGYEGDYCQRYPEMELDQVYPGYVASGSWNYWYLQYFTQSSLQVTVTQTGEAGDCDLYIKQNSDPTRIVYQFADMSLNQEYSIVIQDPANEIWHIGVYGWTTCSYEISAQTLDDCQCTSASHGSCREGNSQCICELSYAGAICDIPTLAITSSQVLSLQFVQPHSWNYYHFTSDSSAISITVVETSTSGDLFVAMSLSGYPSGENFDYYDIGESDFHEIQLSWPITENRVTRTYFIGVLTSSTSVATDPIQYSITAYGTPF